jgi:hypothetical protein
VNKCKLSADSKKGKQLISEHGDTWYVTTEWYPMQCFNMSLGMGIMSLNEEVTRNVKMINDKNFTIYYIMEDKA